MKSCPHCGADMPTADAVVCALCQQDYEEPTEPAPGTAQPVTRPAPTSSEPILWYTTEQRFFRLLKLRWYDDRGILVNSPESAHFSGQRGTLRLAPITGVQMVGLPVFWVSLISLGLGDLLVIFLVWMGFYNHLTLDNPAIYLFLGLTNVMAVCYWPRTWVKVDYLDMQGQTATAYFTCASVTARLFGGTRRLFGRLHKYIRQEQN